MILQCGDLERALRTPELLPDLRAHAETCESCARELYLWNEISRVAPQLHEEWESPFLWTRIQANLQAEPPIRRFAGWRWLPAAAGAVAVLVMAAVMVHPWRSQDGPVERDLLTERALDEVQKSEAAYVKSVERLSEMAQRDLQRSPSPLAAAYREKLALVDAAIADAKAAVAQNRYNAYLREELASLYGEKQKTLQDWLKNANRN